MTWTAPSTVTPGQVATASLWNQQVRDNMKIGRGYAKGVRSSGNITANSTTWANLDTGLDLTLAGSAADVFGTIIDFETGNEAIVLQMDTRAITSGNYFGDAVETNTGFGAAGLATAGAASFEFHNAVWRYTSVSGDYSGGNLAARLRYRTGTAGNKTVGAGTAAWPKFNWFLENRGPNVAP